MMSSRLVGRDHELDQLSNALDKAAAGQPAVVLVSGDAGIGKTRLITELADRARKDDHAVLIGQCAELGDAVPYLPLADALRGAAQDPQAPPALVDGVRQRPILGRLLPDFTDDAQHSIAGAGLTQQQLFGAVLGLLGELARERPVLLVLEDLHWADRATRDLLAFLGRVLQRERICLVGTYRTDDLHRRHPLRPVVAELVRLPTVAAIELGPLPADELAAHLGAVAAPEMIDRVIARAEGNPFYAEELLAAADQEGHADDTTEVPEALADVLLGRVERLSEVAQQVLRVAAVAGRRVDDVLIRDVSGLAEGAYEEALREILASGVLLRDDASGYVFRHALLREAVYNDLMPGERTRLHTSFAGLLESNGGFPAERAYHHLASHNVAGALVASVEAGHEAERMGAPAVAHKHYERALELWDRAPDAGLSTGHDRVHIALHSAAVASASGDPQRAVTHLRRLHDADPRPEVAERLAYYVYELDQSDEAVRIARAAVDATSDGPPTALRARVLATYAITLTWTDRHDEIPDWAGRAIEVARATEATDAEVSALVTLARHAEFAGDEEGAERLFAEAEEKGRHVGHLPVVLRAAWHRARSIFERGDLAAALRVADEGVRLAHDTGLEWSNFGTDLRFLQYLVHYATGDWDRAEALGDTFGARVGTVMQARLSAFALFTEVARGRPIVAERLEGLARFWDEDELVAQSGRGLAAEHALWQGDADAGLEHVFAAFRMLDEFDPVIVRLSATALWALADRRTQDPGDVRQARDLMDRARVAATSGPGDADSRAELGPEGKAWLLRAEAEFRRALGEDDPELWRAAADGFGFGFVYEEARARWRLAEALLAKGDRGAAEEEWRAADAIARRLDAAPLASALDGLARRAGFGSARSGAAGLTGREVEVLRLVALGKNNREIAAELFIAPKTASVHVSNILAKLGVGTRTQAAAVAHREGLV